MEAIVTLVTAGAERADGLSEGQYREIYEELRGKTTLRLFAEFIGSAVSFGWWSKYERGLIGLDRARRNELRRAVGLAELPASVGEATAGIDPDARVWQVGEGRPDRVVLVGEQAHEPVTLRLNGGLQIADGGWQMADGRCQDQAQERGVTGVTGGRRREMRGSIVLNRGQWERLNERRLARGESWGEFMGRLIADG